jgi:hypothetical protein
MNLQLTVGKSIRCFSQPDNGRLGGRGLYLLMAFFEVLHENGHNDVDQDELRHQHKDNEEYGGYDVTDAAVFHAIGGVVAIVPQRVLHYAVPIVARRHPEEGEESHAEITEVRVLPETLAWHLIAAFCGPSDGT